MLSTSQPPKRDRLSLHSFSIRDLFLVTMIVALAVAWVIDHQGQANEVKKLKQQLSPVIDSSWISPPTSSAPALNPPKK